MIFISYRRGESAGYAGRLQESLERRVGKGTVFRDVDDLAPGQDFVNAITDRLRDGRACLVLIGRQWLRATDVAGRPRLALPDDYVRLEIEAALARSDLLVVPVLVEGATMPSVEDLPPTIHALSRRHALSLRDESWDADVRDAVPLAEGREISSTLQALTARRFVNTLRIIATVRVTNNGSYPWLFGADAIRLVVGGQAILPIESPNAVVAAAAAMSGDCIFDVPPSTTRVVLRVIGQPSVDVPFDVPSLP